MLNVRDNASARCRGLGDDTDIVKDIQCVVGADEENSIRENAEKEGGCFLGARSYAKSRDGQISFTSFNY